MGHLVSMAGNRSTPQTKYLPGTLIVSTGLGGRWPSFVRPDSAIFPGFILPRQEVPLAIKRGVRYK